ncbi:flagellar biosynthesis protein FlgE [Mangrovitalea sediminis]|uniref:flagellar biosynthesis protein FlgE n=1 Tax=Mangrovitalea sediminis TaxID=1982043 RepID=UPI000BE6080F|nr:flagellar biosynthesis protein FlgE [Mangrovitalea sediminis]
MINSVINTGLQGLQHSIQGANKAATNIAQAGETNRTDDAGNVDTNRSDDKSLTSSLVDLKLYSQSAKANAKVIEAGSHQLGTLLNIKA